MADRLQCPDDLCRIFCEVLSKPTLKKFLGASTVVCARRLPVVRCWDKFLEGYKVNMHGGLLKDNTANHFFSFLARRGALACL